MQIETVSLLEVIAAARARQASLVPETGGYVMLSLGRAMAGVPVSLDLERILLSTEGQVSLDGPKRAVRGRVACAALQRLLTELLDLSKGHAPALRAAATRPATDEGVEAFFAEIAKALIPINRSAAKRALSRLARETAKAARTGELVRPSIALEDVDRGSEPAVAPPRPRTDERVRTERPGSAAPSEHTTPSPGEHSATLTPTFLDTDVQASHEGAEQASFRELVMRDVVGYLAADARKTSPGAGDERTHGFAQELGDGTSRALDLLARGNDGARTAQASDDDLSERRSRVPKRFVPRREKVVARLDELAPPYAAASVETLLDRFSGMSEEAATLKQVEASLGALGSLHMTPLSQVSAPVEEASPSDDVESDRHAVETTIDPSSPTPSVEIDVLDPGASSNPSRASETPSGQTFEHGTSSVPPLFLERMPRRTGRAVLGVVGILACAAAAVGGLALVRPDLLRRGAAAAPAPVCSADVTLKNLPQNHEVLWRLGVSPTTTRPLPRGVRLELVATAPEHAPQRLVIERDADWPVGVLSLGATLEGSSVASWPAAAAGEVGGTGPAGRVSFTATPASTELWLVVAAGASARELVSLPCDETAHLLVVDPEAPAAPKRLDLEPELLRAAARTGDAEVAVEP